MKKIFLLICAMGFSVSANAFELGSLTAADIRGSGTNAGVPLPSAAVKAETRDILADKLASTPEARTEKLKNRARSWAACLARVFEVFPLICPKCKLELKPVAVILEDKELVRLLGHFTLPAEFPKFRPAPLQYAANRAPPDDDCQLNPVVDQYDNIDPPSPED